MADISEARDQLVQLAASVIYPNGTSAPSIVGVPVIVYAGWPDSATLQEDLRKLNGRNPGGRIHVSVYTRPGEQATTRYRATAQNIDSTPAQLVLTRAGNTVTVSGSIHGGDNLALQVGSQVFTYQVGAGDTLQSIVSVLVGFVPGSVASGLVVTYPSTVNVASAVTGGHGRQLIELRRQRREIQITVWCADDDTRSQLAAPLDVALAATRFLHFADGTGGRLLYVSSPESDEGTPVQLYRRDLIYSVEYATTQVIQSTQIVTASADIQAENANGIVINTN